MKRLMKKFEKVMEAITFAEAGEAETACLIMKDTIDDKQPAGLKAKRVTSLKESGEKTMEAITFAEAGEHEYARELMTQDAKEKKKLLVVGGEDGFSEILVKYALGMAERMDHEIVALNVVPVGMSLFSFLNEKVRAELQQKAEERAEIFREQALGKDISFSHIVKFGDVDRSIKEVHREFKKVSFILTEPDHVTETSDRTCIPVFCLADSPQA